MKHCLLELTVASEEAHQAEVEAHLEPAPCVEACLEGVVVEGHSVRLVHLETGPDVGAFQGVEGVLALPGEDGEYP